jgi:putative heme iron utilization protein
MVPFAVLPDGTGIAIHVSQLATHTHDMMADPRVALLVTGLPEDAETPLALPRVSIQGRAHPCEPGSAEYQRARTAYLSKRPEAEELFSFADFSLFVIQPTSVRYVAGFGRAMSLSPEAMQAVWGGRPEV